MGKILAVYNCCQLGSDQQMPYYIDALRSLLAQTAKNWGKDYQIVVSGCAMNEPSKNTLREYFGNTINLNFIDENYPLSVTFNHTVKKCVEHYGPFEGYLYIDSGINFWDPSQRWDGVELLYNKFKEHDDAVVAAFPSNDDGGSWWGLAMTQEDLILPIGKATNLHCQIFPEKWRATYGHILLDTFASNCQESLFSFLAAAIKKKYLVTNKVSVLHLTNLDGASFGSRRPNNTDRHPMSPNFETGGLFYKRVKSIDETYMEGREFGFGFEECKVYWLHNPKKFDSNHFALDDRLQPFLKKELFLPPELLNYDQIRSQFYPCA